MANSLQNLPPPPKGQTGVTLDSLKHLPPPPKGQKGFTLDQIKSQNQTPQNNSVMGTIGNAAKGVGKFLASSEIGFGNDIAGAVGGNVFSGSVTNGNQKISDSDLQYLKTVNAGRQQAIANGQDTSHYDNILNNFQKTTGQNITDSFPAINKSSAQVLGDAAGTALDIATFGSYGAAADGAKTGQLLTKADKLVAQGTTKFLTAGAKDVTEGFGKRVVKGAIKGAVKNAPIGAAYGADQAIQSGADAKGVVTSAIAGGVFNAVIGGITEGVFSGRKGDPQALKNEAIQQYKQALGATKQKYKEMSDKVVPELLKQGEWGTRSQLLEKALGNQKLAEADYAKLGELQGVAELGGIENTIKSEMEKLKTPSGAVISTESSKYKALQGLQEDITAYKITDQVSKNGGPVAAQQELRTLAQTYGATLYESRKAQQTISDSSTLSQVRKVDGAIRDLLASKNPTYAAINKVYSLNTKLADILNETANRESSGLGMKKLIEAVVSLSSVGTGVIAGIATGHPISIIGSSLIIPALAAIGESTWYKTFSAVRKDALAEKLLAMPAVTRNQALLTLERQGARYAAQLIGLGTKSSASQQ